MGRTDESQAPQEEGDSRSISGIILDFAITSFDWITPLMQTVNDLVGMVSVYGSVAEMKQLERKGIRTYMPMLDAASGMYLWQITQKDYEKARRLKLL